MTQDDYLNLAIKMIKMKAKNPVKRLLLQDDEAIGYMSYRMMKADIDFNPAFNVKLNTFRNIIAEKAVRTLIQRFKKRMKFEQLPFFNQDYKARDPNDIVSDSEELSIIRQRLHYLISFVTKPQRTCIELVFLFEMNHREVGDIVGMSAEGVRKSIMSGIKTMKEIAGAS